MEKEPDKYTGNISMFLDDLIVFNIFICIIYLNATMC